MSISISVPAPMERFIREKVAQGEYESASEVVREGLRLLKNREELWKADIQAKVEKGMAQLRAGKAIPAEQAWSDLRFRREEAFNNAGTKNK